VPSAGGTMTGALTLSGNPTTALGAATKQYVDAIGTGTLPVTGGTLTGALTLAADPTAALQPATKQYVDSHTSALLPLTGGTLSGALMAPTLTSVGTATIGGGLQAATLGVAQSGSQTTAQPAQINLVRNGSGPNDAPMIASNVTVSHSGGALLSYSNIALTTTVNDAVNSSGSFVDGTTSDVYAFVSNLNVNSVTGSGATSTESQHVAITGATTKRTPTGGYPVGRTGAQVWGLWLPVLDATNLPSAISGATTGIELDTSGNNVDSGNSRKGFQFVLSEAQSLASGGYPNEWGYGIYFTTSPTGFYKFQISAGGNYSIAVLDTRNAFPGTAKVLVGLTAPSTTLRVDRALPFTSAGVYGLPISATNASQIKVGSNTYIQVGCTLDGPGRASGVLTFTTAVSVADGTAGNSVIGDSRTIWMASGQQIAFDYAGAASIFYDTGLSALHATASVAVDNALNVKGGLVAGSCTVEGSATFVGGLQSDGVVTSSGGFSGTTATLSGTAAIAGAAQFGGMLIANGGVTVGGSYVALPTYTVAGLPGAPNGAIAYTSNGRKPGEGAGAGTGVMVWVSTNRWLSILSGTQVLA